MPAPERIVGERLVVRSASLHRGSARRLVHLLKYRGVVAAATVLARSMAPLVDDGAVLVPVPRLGWRVLRYGVDPALELATTLGRLTGTQVVAALRAPIWGRSRAGRSHGFAPTFRVRRRVEERVILIDDVVTTGTTLRSAARALPAVRGAITATAAPSRRPLSYPATPEGDGRSGRSPTTHR